jgi:hypothetical protein
MITEKSAELKNLFTALAKVQAEIDPPTKDARVDAGAKTVADRLFQNRFSCPITSTFGGSITGFSSGF